MVTRQQIMNSFPTAGEIVKNKSVQATMQAFKLTGCLPRLVYNEDNNQGVTYEYDIDTLVKSTKLTPEGLFDMVDTGWWIAGEKIILRIG